jgi:hypothetical protein
MYVADIRSGGGAFKDGPLPRILNIKMVNYGTVEVCD